MAFSSFVTGLLWILCLAVSLTTNNYKEFSSLCQHMVLATITDHISVLSSFKRLSKMNLRKSFKLFMFTKMFCVSLLDVIFVNYCFHHELKISS